ncbi:MAG: type II toxin-antitoxin system RelE/ParE family toxin [Deltaproteobacteria bacterium]|nr:type II toxin-antitoxin system RelE/ParE family toxin [Deltaproteobacteria bacterium]
MEKVWITIVETKPFMRKGKSLLSEDEVDAIKNLIATNPECGEIIEGTGGIRKVRIGLTGRGKRGGARVIYYFYNIHFPVFLFDVFAKNEKDNLPKAERNDLAKLSKLLVKTYKPKR